MPPASFKTYLTCCLHLDSTVTVVPDSELALCRRPGAGLPPELPGFGLRVFTSGKRSYVHYRSAGRSCRYASGHKKYAAGLEKSCPAGACLLSPEILSSNKLAGVPADQM
jgi:hypothetical protein